MRRFWVALVACLAGVGAGWAGAVPAGAQPATWNFTQADVAAAQSLGDYGKGVLVAVVDTWVDPTQPEFGGRVVDEADCLSGSCQDRRYAPDSCVHGTHVAGTIASADYGVAPEADILAVQVLSGPSGPPDPSASCTGSTGAVAAGIDFAVAKGARVINLSLGDFVPGLFQSATVSSAVAYAAQHGVVVVFAAGNQGVPLTDSYGHDALIVAATGPSGQLAGYSNFNTAVTGDVNVAAPGGDSGSGSCTASTCVLSTFPDRQLGLLEGTSMAAPHVSGLAALLLAQDPARGAAGVFSAIEKTARPLAGAGSGLIDAGKALGLEAEAHPPGAPASPGPNPGGAAPATTAATPSAAPVPSRASSAPVAVRAPAPAAGSASRSASTAVAAPDETRQHRAATGQGAPRAAARSEPGGAGTPAGWAGRHAVALLLACALVAADVLALVWLRARGAGPAG